MFVGIIQRLHDDWYVYENCEIKLLEQVSIGRNERNIQTNDC